MSGTILERHFPETRAGGFTRRDGTIEFYTRINALLDPGMTVADLGAGRGARFHDGSRRPYRRQLTMLRGKVREVIGVDVDPAVLDNPGVDRAIVMPDPVTIPLPDGSVDLAVSDFTFEHVEHPEPWAREIERVLRPGGWLCARTPNSWHYFPLVSRLLSDRRKKWLLGTLQPSRQHEDVFPTHDRMNSLGTLRRLFPPARWQDASYGDAPEPGYLPPNRLLWSAVLSLDHLLPAALAINLMVFKRKR